ncbi:type IV pilin protein (plasmid) [Legionella sp. D16C41]|uniref:type IV pilin protein n=1 Tax=Legionella sp. D16C41 TaxID=3402688 RepID=UPI003AF68813
MKHKAFTLVEILIVIVIIGILVTIALPSYQNYLLRARRADAWSALTQDQTILERCYAQNFSYNGTCGNLPAYPHNSAQGFYSITLSNLSASTYTLTATAISTQAKDTACATLTLDQANQKSGTSSSCWSR